MTGPYERQAERDATAAAAFAHLRRQLHENAPPIDHCDELTPVHADWREVPNQPETVEHEQENPL